MLEETEGYKNRNIGAIPLIGKLRRKNTLWQAQNG